MRINMLNPISFGAHYINVDIGASSLDGSYKIRTVDENGNTIASGKTTVFLTNESRSEDIFEKNVAQHVIDFEKTYKKEIEEKDPDNEMYLTVCYPGPKVAGKNSGFLLSNFFYDDKKQQRFKRPISPDNIDKLLKTQGVNVKQTRHVNDMAGAGACLLNKLETNCPEMLKEGNEIILLYPGGGLGSGVISIDKNKIIIKPTEIQHIKFHNEEKSLEENVGALRITENFAKAINLDEESTKKIGSNNKAICEYEECKRIIDIDKETHLKGSQIAVDKYMDSVAQLIATQICATKTQDIVLTGNIAHGIRDMVNENPNYKNWDNKTYKSDDSFTAIMKQKVNNSLSNVGKAILGDPNNLNIKFIKINDNTEGAQVLQKCEEVGNPTAWFNYFPNLKL